MSDFRRLPYGKSFHLTCSDEAYEELKYVPGEGGLPTYDGSMLQTVCAEMDLVCRSPLISKKILRHGEGIVVPGHSEVGFGYDVYLENYEIPILSTSRGNCQVWVELHDDKLNTLLERAIATMKKKEKAQFLIYPTLVRDMDSSTFRLALNTPVIVEVELYHFIDTMMLKVYPTLTPDWQVQAPLVYQYALAALAKGLHIYERGQLLEALRLFDAAVLRLMECSPTIKEIPRNRGLSVIIHFHRAQCLFDLKEDNACSTICEIIYELCRRHFFIVPDKVKVLHLQALQRLNEFYQASPANRQGRNAGSHLQYIDFCLEQLRKTNSSKEVRCSTIKVTHIQIRRRFSD